jgi:hypothetical protein
MDVIKLEKHGEKETYKMLLGNVKVTWKTVKKCAVAKIIGWCLVFNLPPLKFLVAVPNRYRYIVRNLRE